MKDKQPPNLASDLLSHPWEEPSVFTPGALIEAVRAERRLPEVSVPEVCLLDFDGDLTDWLIQSAQVRRWESWACFHTQMEAFDVEGVPVGLIARTIGGPYTRTHRRATGRFRRKSHHRNHLGRASLGHRSGPCFGRGNISHPRRGHLVALSPSEPDGNW